MLPLNVNQIGWLNVNLYEVRTVLKDFNYFSVWIIIFYTIGK